MATYPLVIWTIRSYVENGYTVDLWCTVKGCGWRDPPDLGELAKTHGEKPLRDLSLVCARHGKPLGLTIHPPQLPGGDFRFAPALKTSGGVPHEP